MNEGALLGLIDHEIPPRSQLQTTRAASFKCCRHRSMRLWSLHPRYLDAKGLLALWREGLLAQKVLAGETKGYRHHPQLQRFRSQPDACGTIAAYLREVQHEAERRGYRFDAAKIGQAAFGVRMTVTRGQLAFELAHLREKLAGRAPQAFQHIVGVSAPEPHPLFKVVPGEIEAWEVYQQGLSGKPRLIRYYQ